ncbi:peptidoglycan-binding protein [Aquabacterium sp.]|uniref:peptidoglycan-binding domain-containing protein n=1 Tax=Aquabacterium sp. TaxID=1872578 RepID=UPI0037833D85
MATPPPFPGRLIQRGEADRTVVTLIQQALAARGYGPFTPGVFDAAMVSVVKLFQSQNVDGDGHALQIDGVVGLYTWGALYPQPAPAPQSAPSTLMLHALAVAGTQEGQREDPLGSNRGPMVDEYLRAVNIDPTVGGPDQRNWCAAFVYWAFRTAAQSLATPNPLPRTAGCLDHWNKARTIAGAQRITAAQAYANPALVKPGQVFILDLGGGAGHTGLVERLLGGGRLATIEGNTSAEGSRTGVGVFRLQRRKLSDASLKGLIDYSGVAG